MSCPSKADFVWFCLSYCRNLYWPLQINELFKKYPFKLAADSVRIMEGNDEGIFSWFTVNFLNGKLTNINELEIGLLMMVA